MATEHFAEMLGVRKARRLGNDLQGVRRLQQAARGLFQTNLRDEPSRGAGRSRPGSGG